MSPKASPRAHPSFGKKGKASIGGVLDISPVPRILAGKLSSIGQSQASNPVSPDGTSSATAIPTPTQASATPTTLIPNIDDLLYSEGAVDDVLSSYTPVDYNLHDLNFDEDDDKTLYSADDPGVDQVLYSYVSSLTLHIAHALLT